VVMDDRERDEPMDNPSQDAKGSMDEKDLSA
jgi:hypothetical protein